MKKFLKSRAAIAAFPLSVLGMAVSGAVYAQQAEQAEEAATEKTQTNKPKIVIRNPIEEVLILGRIQSAAGDIVLERMEQEVAVDLIGAELISRVGDSNVASALKRVPGVTLVDDKFVFVRGLGERYASTSLNGAVVPSPDLTRNVVPLDIFPTSIVQSISVQKMASADMPAAFGGGSVDIRTKSTPEDFVFSLEIGTGDNSNSGDFFTYNGGGDDSLGKDDGTRALSPAITDAITRYRGDLLDIAEIDNISDADAEAINRGLAAELNRDIGIREDSGKIDQSYEVNIGNAFDIGDEMSIGFLAGLSYDSSWRNSEKSFVLSNNLISGTDTFQDQAFEKESTYNVSITGNLGFGFRLNDENIIETTSLFLRNTDDETAIRDSFNSDSTILSGGAARTYKIRYEQREMHVNQIRGDHELGFSTLDLIGLDWLKALEGLKFDWYFSDSDATTDIPNQVSVAGRASFIEPFSLATGGSSIQRNVSVADFRFTELEDNVESFGWELAFPIETDSTRVNLSVGSEYWEKARTYKQLQFGLGSNNPNSPILGTPDEIFTDANITNPDFGFRVNTTGANSDSYLAANKVSAGFGKIDITWDETFRVAAGIRWEDYQQVGLSWDPLDFDGNQIIPDNIESRAYEPTVDANGNESNVIGDFFRDATFADDDIYTSLALTYMAQNFIAEDFQLRFGFSETTVRPDLREITDSSYIDPITDFLVFGESDLIPAEFKNYDVRAEWFFGNGDNLTVSMFYKDIENPIDQQEVPRAEDDRAVAIFNAESAEILGLEVEFLKSLGNVAEVLEPFFIQGNMTLLDTETVAGENAINPTNEKRDLVGASDAANIILGFDSDDGKHAATISYNWFGERLFFAGRAGQDDVFEKPSSSLDMTYSFYPTEQFTVKLKGKNLTDEKLSLEREGESFELLNEEKGISYSLSLQYNF